MDGCVHSVESDKSAWAVYVTETCHDRLDSTQRGDDFQTFVGQSNICPVCRLQTIEGSSRF